MDELGQLLELDMEYRLTVALRSADGGCDCIRYFISRRDVLIPEILKQSKVTGEDAAYIFHRFQKGVHARHEAISAEGPV